MTNIYVLFVFYTSVPDLVVNVEELQKRVRIDSIPLSYLRCSYEENCLGHSARTQWSNNRLYTRRLLRFTTRVENRGLAPFRPDVPKSAWQWHECHSHFHSMEVFSTYDLIGKKIVSCDVFGAHLSVSSESAVTILALYLFFNCFSSNPKICKFTEENNHNRLWVQLCLRELTNPEN
jgi:hypothetical protein